MTNYSCIVVGGGMSGLSAAYALYQRGVNVLLVEASEYVGGAIRSEQTADGFSLEHGTNTVTSKAQELWDHFEDLGIADQKLVAAREGGRRFIVHNGAPTLIPMSPPAFLKSSLLSTKAKLRLFAEPLIPRAVTPDENIRSFFTRRLGTEPAQVLVDPFVSGVYAGNPLETSVRSAFSSMWEAEQQYGSIVIGMIAGGRAKAKAQPKPKGPRPRSVLFTFQGGLASWPNAIADALGPDRVWLNSPATGLRKIDRGWELTVNHAGQPETLTTDRVVLASPAYVSADLVADIDPDAAKALRKIFYPPMAVVHLGFRREDVEHPMDGFGMLCPSREQRKVLGVLWPSALFPGRAPEGVVLTSSFVGGARVPYLATQDNEAIIDTVIKEHQELLGARGEPVMAKVANWPRAIAQYFGGHDRILTAVKRMEAMWSGLYLIGNYRDGVSVGDCWKNGRALAERIAEYEPSRLLEQAVATT